MNRWLNKEDVVHTHSGILLSHKKGWNIAISDNMDGSWEYHTKWISQTEKSKNHMISLICRILNRKQQMNKQTHRHRKRYGGYQRERGLGVDNKG